MMFKSFTFSNLKKHFTIVNIIVGLISLTIGVLFRFSPLPTLFLDFCGLDSSELNKYILAGFFGLTVRLGIKGVAEDIIESFLVKPLKMNLGDILNPSTPSENSQGNTQSNPQQPGNQYPDAGGSEGNPQQGSSQGSPQDNNRYNRSPSPSPEDIKAREGFYVDQYGRISIYDPSNVGRNGMYHQTNDGRRVLINGSFQPYATNLSKALEYYNKEVTNVTANYSFINTSDAFSNNDKRFVRNAAEYMGKTKDLDRNSKPLRKFLKRLP